MNPLAIAIEALKKIDSESKDYVARAIAMDAIAQINASGTKYVMLDAELDNALSDEYKVWLTDLGKYIEPADFWPWLERAFVDGLKTGRGDK